MELYLNRTGEERQMVTGKRVINKRKTPLRIRILACGTCLFCIWALNNITEDMLVYITFVGAACWGLRKPLCKVIAVLASVRLPKFQKLHLPNTGMLGEIKLRILERKIAWYDRALKNAKAKRDSVSYTKANAKKQILDTKRKLIVKERLKSIKV